MAVEQADAHDVRVAVERRIDAPVEAVWEAVADIDVTEAMLPGCRQLRFGVDRDHVRAGDEGTATLAVDVGPLSPSFETDVTVRRRDYPEMALTASGAAAGSQFDTTAELTVAPADEATDVRWVATATVTGRLERFAGGLRPVVEHVADRFFDRLDDRLTDRDD
ncbi:CoxG family protein [Halosegnis sp.]|uniref:CoxG family protein n=1 Tax=Halosegnis sp. TaxID=2864959 RepID=UPI0035D3F6EC